MLDLQTAIDRELRNFGVRDAGIEVSDLTATSCRISLPRVGYTELWLIAGDLWISASATSLHTQVSVSADGPTSPALTIITDILFSLVERDEPVVVDAEHQKCLQKVDAVLVSKGIDLDSATAETARLLARFGFKAVADTTSAGTSKE